jgi:hypothetical protein
MHKMPTVGRPCIMHAPRCEIRFLLYPPPRTFRKGYLDIVRWLCEQGGAAVPVNGVRGVDTRSKGGWTPLSEFGWITIALKLRVSSECVFQGPPSYRSLPPNEAVCGPPRPK